MLILLSNTKGLCRSSFKHLPSKQYKAESPAAKTPERINNFVIPVFQHRAEIYQVPQPPVSDSLVGDSDSPAGRQPTPPLRCRSFLTLCEEDRTVSSTKLRHLQSPEESPGCVACAGLRETTGSSYGAADHGAEKRTTTRQCKS